MDTQTNPATDANPQRSRSGDLLPYFFLALVLAVTVFVRLRLLTTPLERDEGEYAYTGQLLLKGIPPYVNAYTMKLPGVSVAYACAMLLFGQSAAAVRLGLMLTNLASVLLVVLIGRILLDTRSAVCAGACYAVLSLSQSVYGVFAHATHFVVLFTLAGAYLLLRERERLRPARLFTSGFCFGLAVTMKQHAALFVIFALLYLAWRFVQKRTVGRTSVSRILLFLAAAALPFLLVLLWCAVAGSLGALWLWTVKYAGAYATGQTPAQGLPDLTDAVDYFLSTQPDLWLAAFIGAVFLCTGRGRCADRPFLLCFTIFSLLSVLPGFYFRRHYFVTLLPAVALLAGAAVYCAATLPLASRALRSLPFFIFVACVALGLYHEKDYFYLRSPEEVSRTLYGSNPFPEAVEVARYLKAHTASSDRITVLGSEPEIYFYARRLSATGHIYMYGLMEDQPYAGLMQQQLIAQIEEARPKYLVLAKVWTSWLHPLDSRPQLEQWIGRYLPQYYDPVGMVEIFQDQPAHYQWSEQASLQAPTTENYLVVFRRKEIGDGVAAQHLPGVTP